MIHFALRKANRVVQKHGIFVHVDLLFRRRADGIAL